MFTCSGTDFYDVYTGVGARRIRETFEKMRNFAPAILFIDEFDALGAARGSASGGTLTWPSGCKGWCCCFHTLACCSSYLRIPACRHHACMLDAVLHRSCCI